MADEQEQEQQLQLTKQLIDNVLEAVVKQDPRAQDPLVTCQYLAAIMGYIVGNQGNAAGDKRGIIEQLGAFAQHVSDDIEQQKQAQAPSGEAFGTWKPDS